MATYLSNELAGDTTGLTTSAPVGYKPQANLVGARVKSFKATITFASQASGSLITLGKLPNGAAFAYGVITVGTSTSTATISVGTAASAAAYSAAAAYTTTDTPVVFGKAAGIAGLPVTDDTTVYATVGTAALPASGTAVIQVFFTSAN